jgi:hypothetical protein
MSHRTYGSPTGRVRQVELPPAARALSTLARIDYEDAFLADGAAAPDRTPEQWAHTILRDAPLAMRARLLAGWSVLGLKLGGASSAVLGWEMRSSTSEFALLGADSRIGMPAELLIKRDAGGLLFATLVQHDHRIARAMWAAVEPGHLRVVPYLLEQAVQRLQPIDPPKSGGPLVDNEARSHSREILRPRDGSEDAREVRGRNGGAVK